MKQQLSPGKVPLSSQLQSSQSPVQRPSAKCLEQTHALPFIGSMTSCSRATSECSGLNGGKASDWLRQTLQCESQFLPKSFTPFSKQYPFGALQLPLRALQLHIPSRLEGKWGTVDRKAGGLADARHIDFDRHNSDFLLLTKHNNRNYILKMESHELLTRLVDMDEEITAEIDSVSISG